MQDLMQQQSVIEVNDTYWYYHLDLHFLILNENDSIMFSIH